MKGKYFVLLCFSSMLYSCSPSELSTRIANELKVNTINRLQGVELDSVYIANRALNVCFIDTSSYYSQDYSNLLFYYSLNLFYEDLEQIDAINFQHLYTKLNYNYKWSIGLDEYLPYYTIFNSNSIYDSLFAKLLFGLPRRDYVQLEYSIEFHNKIFMNYNYHEKLSGMIMNCVQNCDTNSLDYRAMKSVALVSINTNESAQVELFNIISNYCLGRAFEKDDITDFPMNGFYFDSLQREGSKIENR